MKLRHRGIYNKSENAAKLENLSNITNQLSFAQGLRQHKENQYLMGWLPGAMKKTWLSLASVPLNIMEQKMIKAGQTRMREQRKSKVIFDASFPGLLCSLEN